MLKTINILFFITLCFSLGCSSVCERARLLEIPAAPIDEAVDEATADPLFELTDWVPQNWWTIFDDPQLALLICTALDKNPTIHEAYAKILAAEYEADRSRSYLFPVITWTGDVLREKFSKTGLISPPSNSPGVAGTGVSSRTVGAAIPAEVGAVPFYFTQYETALNLSYNFDVWGKNRETLRAAIGQMNARIADEAFTRLNLSLSVAQTYFRLQIEYQRQKLYREIVQNREHYFRLITDRISSNVENNLTLNAIEIDLARSKQALLQIQGSIAVYEHQLQAYLAANFDEEFLILQIDKQPLPKVPLPVEIPMRLLAHRPDIMAQLWTIESAGHLIDVAKAGFYPDIDLLSFFGFQTIHFRKWFWAKSTYWAVDPAFTLPIFDGGLLISNLNTREVNYDMAVYRYNQLILSAVREVLDGIVVLQNSHQQLTLFKQEVQNQQTITKLTEQRMRSHLNSQLDVLNSERTTMAARDQELIALGNTIQSILLLIKALGGGYDVCQTECLEAQP